MATQAPEKSTIIAFQRDRATRQTCWRLFKQCLTLARLKLSGGSHEWTLIRFADTLRVMCCYRFAIKLADSVAGNTHLPSHRFWALHVLATAQQYAGRHEKILRLSSQLNAQYKELCKREQKYYENR